MTDLRMWSQLSPEERAEAVTKARGIIDGGEARWHVVARLCGIKGGIGLRTAIDEGWRAQQKAEGRDRAKRNRAKANPARVFDKTPSQRAVHAERGRKSARVSAMFASAARRGSIKGMLNTPGHGPITLPRLKWMEE